MSEPWVIVVLLGAVVLLYAVLLPNQRPKAELSEEVLDSVGDTLQHFVEEIEQENKELVRVVGEMKREHEQRATALMRRIEQLEQKPAPQFTSEQPPKEASVFSASAAAAAPQRSLSPIASSRDKSLEEADKQEEPAAEAAVRNNGIRTRHEEVFHLYDQGKSMEYIAKKLGKNKGEVQLIIGLAKQEEPSDGRA